MVVGLIGRVHDSQNQSIVFLFGDIRIFQIIESQILQHFLKYYVGQKPFNEESPHCLVMKVAGMGDQNTVDLATAAHVNVLEGGGLLPPSERLQPPAPPFGQAFTSMTG